MSRARFSPDSSGCETYRFYNLKKDIFSLTLNLIIIESDNPYLEKLLGKLPALEEMILKYNREKPNLSIPAKPETSVQDPTPGQLILIMTPW